MALPTRFRRDVRNFVYVVGAVLLKLGKELTRSGV